MKRYIYHICQGECNNVSEYLRKFLPRQLEENGFIHLSDADQLCGTANRYFSHLDRILILRFSYFRLAEKIVYEDLYARGEPFPHLYGLLKKDALSGYIIMRKDMSGEFKFSAETLTSADWLEWDTGK